jgi:hypothetical protein
MHRSRLIKTTWTAIVGASLLLGSLGYANERHFTYTYETATLPQGEVEFEPWTTIKFGRNDYYARFDQQLEFEFGITDNLQMAWYIVYSAYAQDITDPATNVTTVKKAWKMPGIKSEWKYKLSDPVADGIGSALYLELVGKPHEFEVEAKVLLDKKIGKWFVAFNAVVEAEWENEGDEVGKKLVLEADLGIAYQPFPGFSVGLEVRHVNQFADMKDFEKSILYAGPVVSYGTDKWWVATTILPQVYAIKGASDNSILDLEGHERVEARVLFGIHL